MKHFFSLVSRLSPVAERLPFCAEAKRFRYDGSLARHLIACLLLATITGGNTASAQIAEVRAELSVFAGTIGVGSADGTGAAARFTAPAGVTVDKDGNLYIADTGNGTIRKITPGGVVTTFAGAPGQWGSTDASGAAARFATPVQVAVDNSGNVFVADSANGAIRKVTPAGQVSTFDLSAAQPAVNAPSGIAVTPDGQTVYFSDRGNNVIRRIVGNGPVTVFAGDPLRSGTADGDGAAARFYEPAGLIRDAAGALYVADSRNHTVRKITAAGAVTTLAGTAGMPGTSDAAGLAAKFYLPRAVAVDTAGNVYVADTGNHAIRKIAATTRNVTTVAGTAGVGGSAEGAGAAAGFDFPAGIAALGDGTLFVADSRNNAVRKITPAGVVTTFAGVAPGVVDGSGAAARFREPRALACDAAGNVYVADTLNSTIRKSTPAGVVTTWAGSAGRTGSVDGTGAAARFNQPEGILAAADGTLYVSDTLNHTIRKITTGGVVSTLAGVAGTPGDSNGTGAAARFRHPQGLAFDRDGNLIVADTFNNLIRRVTPAGVVTTVVGNSTYYGVGGVDGSGVQVRFEHPTAVAVNSAGEIFVADGNNFTIRKVTPGGVVSTVYGQKGRAWTADGAGTDARFRRVTALVCDPAGNLLVADPDAEAIRFISTAGRVFTLAGMADTRGGSDGAGPAARLFAPHGLALGPNGKLYVADTGNHVIRGGPVVTGTPPTITQHPSNQFIYVGSGVIPTFTVVATNGGGTLHYRWQRQPKWGEWTDLVDDGVFAGTSTATLTVPGYGPELHDNSIRCLVDNGFSTTVESSSGMLWVISGNPVRIADDAADIELFTTVTRLAGKAPIQSQWGYSWGIADGVGANATFSGPRGIAIDAAGISYVVDSSSGTIRKILPDGTVTTLAGLGVDNRSDADRAAAQGGSVVVTVPPGPVTPAAGWGNADGTGASARFAGPQALALAPDGNLIVADTENGILRRVTPAGVVTTLRDGQGVPHRFRRPLGVAVDSLGAIYVSDTDDFTVRRIAPDGTAAIVAGRSLVSGAQDGPGPVATFSGPGALAVDAAGVLYLVDRGNQTIRRIAPDGTVSTFAGLAGAAGTEDGTGSAARFAQPAGLAIDSRGMLYVADTANHVIRMITPAGRVTTIAGAKPAVPNQGGGFLDGTGAAARFWNPWAIACDNRGNLVVTDAGNSMVRRVETRLPAIGETLKLHVYALGSPGGFTWQVMPAGSSTWSPLTSGGAYTISSDPNASDLHLVAAAAFDGNRYRCAAVRGYDGANDISRATVIVVGIAPTVMTQPVAKTAVAGQGATFTVAATGTPAAFAYRWQRKPAGASTTWANLADGAAYRGTGTATLTLTAVGGAMNGDQFRCVVDNYVASAATSSAATLTASGEAYVDFASWRAGNAVTGDANAVQPGSGVTNLARYAFGLAPSGVVANPVSVTTTSGTGSRSLQVGFKRKTAASDVHYVIQASTDLVTWTTFKTIEPGLPIDVLEQDNVAVGSVPRRFLRVRVEPKP